MEFRSAVSSLMSVPKPLKFLRPKFEVLKGYHVESMGGESEKLDRDTLFLSARLGYVLAVLAMTVGNHEERESLKFMLTASKDYSTIIPTHSNPTAATDNSLSTWDHEFVCSLLGEIGQEYNFCVLAGAGPETGKPFQDLLTMVDEIVPFNVAHNAETEVIDLLIEVQRLK